MSANKSPAVVDLALKVVPGASKNVIAGWLGDQLKVRVSASPERGKANAAVEKLVATRLGLPGSAVAIVAGHNSARKRVEITGLEALAILQKLGKPGYE